MIGANSTVLKLLEDNGSTALKTGTTMSELIRRPELNYDSLASIDPARPQLEIEVREQINIQVKYDGYIQRQMKQVKEFKKMEKRKLPLEFDYSVVGSLRKEAVQKLNLIQPISIGHASRISGVSPADITVLLIYMEQNYRKENKENE